LFYFDELAITAQLKNLREYFTSKYLMRYMYRFFGVKLAKHFSWSRPEMGDKAKIAVEKHEKKKRNFAMPTSQQ